MIYYSRVYLISLCIFALFSVTAQKPATAEIYKEASVRRHVEKLLEGVPPPFGKWGVPILYGYAGIEDKHILQLVSDRMAYFRRLTQHQISPAKLKDKNRKLNFLMIESEQYEDLLKNDNAYKQLAEPGESREEFAEKLKAADADTQFAKRYAKRFIDENRNVKAFILLDKLSNHEDNVPNGLLKIITDGLIDANQSDEIVPSIFNSREPNKGYFAKNVNRLPLIDEAFIRIIYTAEYNQDEPQEIIVSKIASQVYDLIISQDSND